MLAASHARAVRDRIRGRVRFRPPRPSPPALRPTSSVEVADRGDRRADGRAAAQTHRSSARRAARRSVTTTRSMQRVEGVLEQPPLPQHAPRGAGRSRSRPRTCGPARSRASSRCLRSIDRVAGGLRRRACRGRGASPRSGAIDDRFRLLRSASARSSRMPRAGARHRIAARHPRGRGAVPRVRRGERATAGARGVRGARPRPAWRRRADSNSPQQVLHGGREPWVEETPRQKVRERSPKGRPLAEGGRRRSRRAGDGGRRIRQGHARIVEAF